MSISTLSAAKFACEASGWQLTNMQLQKILYIAQMLYAGQHAGKRLLTAPDFEAWDCGPVSRTLYERVRCFGAGRIKNIFLSIEPADAASEEIHFLARVLRELESFELWRLVRIVQGEHSAWSTYYRPGVPATIPHAAIAREYEARGLHLSLSCEDSSGAIRDGASSVP